MNNSNIPDFNNILIIDSLSENLQILTKILTEKDYKVRQAINSTIALDLVVLTPPDLILLNHKMPDINGYDISIKLKSNLKTAAIPIIFIGDFDEVIDKISIFKVGGVDYINKPFLKEEVIARIETQLTILKEKWQLRKNQEILYQSRSFLSTVLNNSLDGIAAMQAIRDVNTREIVDFRFLVVNPMITRILGKTQEELINQVLFNQIFTVPDPNLFSDLVKVVQDSKKLEKNLEYCLDNYKKWYHLIIVKLGDGVVIIMRDITKQEILKLELNNQMKLDPLTKIANRNLFAETLEKSWQHCRREQQPLSLIMCDLDYFKAYNNYFGDQQANECLIKVAKAINNSVKRSTDLVARYEEDKFALILLNTNHQGAVRVAQLVRLQIKQLEIPNPQSKINDYLTISIGITTIIPNEELSPENLIAQAEQALYQAKKQGRNRFKLYI